MPKRQGSDDLQVGAFLIIMGLLILAVGDYFFGINYFTLRVPVLFIVIGILLIILHFV
jgi:hypothetical protein